MPLAEQRTEKRDVSERESRLPKHYALLRKLAKGESLRGGNVYSFLQEVTETAAHTMDVARVNVWLFDEGRTKIICKDDYDLATGQHTSGVEILAADYPRYFRALEEERAIVANDAHADPRTVEFSNSYLDVHGITSMMDTPLHAGGTVIGIICHEHIGRPRTWTLEEQQFAGSLADLAALALESAERKQAEKALKQSEARTRAILSNALDAIVTVDENSVIVEWNPRATIVFGWTREEAIGRTLYETVIPKRDHSRHRAGVAHFLATGEAAIFNRRIEITAIDKAGREFPVELSVSPQRIGDTWEFSAFVRDITSRVRAEQELHELNVSLEERVHERTEQLESAMALKERLLQELRTSRASLVEKVCELEQQSEIIDKDLRRAQVIQRALLPSRPPKLERVHVDALYRPGRTVGGDLYDVSTLGDGRIALYVADATGHGVAAAMLSVLFKQKLEMCDPHGCALPPSEVLARVNDRLCAEVLSPGMFLTAAYMVFDTETYELRAASAGHTPMLLIRENGESRLLERTGPGLGIAKTPHFAEHRVDLKAGDRLVLYTDGLIDGIESRGSEGLRALITSAMATDGLDGPQKLRMLYHGVAQRAAATAGGCAGDDVTVLVLEARHGPSHLDNDPEEPVHTAEAPLRRAQRSPGGSSAGAELWSAEGEGELYLSLRGRGTWTSADTFRDLAIAALRDGHQLHIDLGDCAALDSTFLGTLHEIVTLDAPGTTHVYGPSEVVRHMFTELGLMEVLGAIRSEAIEPPSDPVLVPTQTPSHSSHELLLRAHEALCQLSAENRERFAGVVESLRTESANR